MRRVLRHQKPGRALTCEALEQRLTMSGVPAWTNAGSLSLSFVPDGTRVGDDASALEAALAGQAGLSQWKETIARAFQTWARHADINVGVVPDSGPPLGIRGKSHADSRFGDIRIAGIPLSSDTTAEAIDHAQSIAGTWSGDVVFNTSANWPSDAALFSVALHEAGHVLGLEHSSDPNSPMFVHGISQSAGPTAADIAALQALYGPRRGDVHEKNAGNDTIARASRIPHAEPTDGFDGTSPLIVFGDVLDGQDRDVHLLPLLPGYQGAMTFELRTQGLSQLQGRISVLDQQGNVLAQSASTAALGDVVTLHLSAATGERYFLQVEAADTGVFASGGYAVVVKYDELIAASDAQIARLVVDGFRWQARTDDSAAEVDTRRLVTNGSSPLLDDDQHQDDELNTARRLDPVADSPAARRFQFIGTIADASDVDVFRVRSQDTPSASRGLTVVVESLEADGLIPLVSVLDMDGNSLPLKMLANGNGTVVLRVENVVENSDYLLQIRGASSSLGNYAFLATFDDLAAARTSLFAEDVTAQDPAALSKLYVARPQLFNFALQSAPVAGAAADSIWATVYDERQRTVAFVGSPVGGFRSAPSVLLQPGTYHILVEARDASGLSGIAASFVFYADAISDPVGPPLLNPGEIPIFACGGATDLFCYPDLPPVPDPFVVAPDPAPPPTSPTEPVVPPIDFWFWPPDFLPTNPLLPLDVNGDGKVSPFDALQIVNALNARGAGPVPLPPRDTPYLDPSGDGRVTPRDALLVIDELNRRANAAAAAAPSTSQPAMWIAAADALAQELGQFSTPAGNSRRLVRSALPR